MPHVQTSGKDWLWEPTRQAIYLRDGDQCVVCGDGPHVEAVLSVDHLDPCGSNKPDNLVTLCCSCNSSRRDRPLEEWWTPDAARRCREAAARPLTRELRDAGRARANELRPGRFNAHRLRRLNQTHRARMASLPDAEAPF